MGAHVAVTAQKHPQCVVYEVVTWIFYSSHRPPFRVYVAVAVACFMFFFSPPISFMNSCIIDKNSHRFAERYNFVSAPVRQLLRL